MNSKRCCICKLEKSVEEFSIDKNRNDGLQTKCSSCQKAYGRQHYDDNKKKYKECLNKRRVSISKLIADYKTGKCCTRCPESHSSCLDFHHRNRDNKRFSISKARGRGYKLSTVIEEIEKCDLLCANCHRKLHYEEKLSE